MFTPRLSRRHVLGMAPAAGLTALGSTLLPHGLLHAQTPVSGNLSLYTSQPDRDARGTIAAFNAQYPNVKVNVFRSGTTEVMNRLRTEMAAGSPRADVLLIADAISMESLKADGRLMRLQHIDTQHIPQRYFDNERTYIGTKLISTGIVVNAKSSFKPKSWKDLLNPALKGQVIMPSPLYSGAAAITVGAWSRTPDLGWAFIEGLKANKAMATKGNGAVLQQVANGEKMAGVLVDFMALNAKAKGSPVEFVTPKEGLTYVTEPAAILNTASNIPAAQAFVSFLVSPEGQKFSTTLGYFPLQGNIPTPAGYPKVDSLRFLPFDANALLAGAETDRKRFSEIFGG
ncbi:ABC transporter substrate-binding protein [Rhodoferax sp.]|uniref:ABC transporter substrate-binding protein n=1 Tax=Rhodoferax sp. TaxID=50421 RepID=UPI00284AAD72|nr:ABC transporter substrate-binding protein [Rhodoferax sp.]MDR3371544.1 ABC transporter substrate-binding protein [Rhodoferax sp.]